MVKALAMLADLYKAGVMPRNMATLNNEEITTWMQQGRAAMTIQPFARLASYNDPQRANIRASSSPSCRRWRPISPARSPMRRRWNSGRS